MFFYEESSSPHTDLLNTPFITNNNNTLNEHYIDNFSSITYPNIDTICENIEQQHSYQPWSYPNISQVEPPYSVFLFKPLQEMEFDLSYTNPIIKSEYYKDDRLKMSIDNNIQSLFELDDIYTNENTRLAPSSPKSVASCSSSNHSTTSESKKRIHQCTYCTRSFVRKHDLIRHKRIHTGIKPYQCPCCLKSFSRSDARRHHFRKVAACRDGAEKLPRRCK